MYVVLAFRNLPSRGSFAPLCFCTILTVGLARKPNYPPLGQCIGSEWNSLVGQQRRVESSLSARQPGPDDLPRSVMSSQGLFHRNLETTDLEVVHYWNVDTLPSTPSSELHALNTSIFMHRPSHVHYLRILQCTVYQVRTRKERFQKLILAKPFQGLWSLALSQSRECCQGPTSLGGIIINVFNVVYMYTKP